MATDDLGVWLEAQRFSGAGARSRQSAGWRAFTVTPLVVDFGRLLRLKNPCYLCCSYTWPHCLMALMDIWKVSTQELAHIVTALYDICLPNVGPKDLRSTICAIGTKTIILVRNEQEVYEEYSQKTVIRPIVNITGTKSSCITENLKEEKLRVFAAVFSDTESSEEDSKSNSDQEENENEEQLKTGLKQFLSSVQERRQQRKSGQENGDLSCTAIGIEARIVAALSYVRSAMKSGDRVVQLMLLSTRKRYRGCGVGHYLMQRNPASAVISFFTVLMSVFTCLGIPASIQGLVCKTDKQIDTRNDILSLHYNVLYGIDS
ncbi:uncharacterized protein LOC119971435 isoform X2 [Scyliorhinus canicula]|uniref:uncharacterized protein LOC119971435 isoform X2 n=1 Tax=Scyliorhinus canicula TaxID=7830 RepID=UPI0018F52E87|nr:uncharacterized protein LOC119971435 isoform X2 [Scyliorhinus canicula]